MAIGKERRFYSEDKNKFLEDFCKQRLTYGNIEGNPEFKAGVCKLYKTINLDEIIPVMRSHRSSLFLMEWEAKSVSRMESNTG